MRYWAIGWAILGVGLLGLAVGCEAESGSDESAEYDPDLDAPPSNLTVRSDHNLMADQALLAARQAKAAAKAGGTGTPAGSGTTGAGAGDPATREVREIMGKLIDAAKSGQYAAMLPYLSPEDRPVVEPAVTGLTELATASAAFETAVKENLGMKEMPPSLQQVMGRGQKGGPAVAAVGDLTADMLNYEVDGNSVTVTGGNAPMKFTRTASGWQMVLSDREKTGFALMGDFIKAQTALVKTLGDGIKDGRVNQNNLDQKALELMEQLIKPAMEKMLKGMLEGTSGGGTGGGETP